MVKKWAIVGDAALGVPYFRALNAGLLCGTELAKALSVPSSSNSPLSSTSPSSLRKRGSSQNLHSLEQYAQYVQQRVQKEIKKAKAKDSAVNFGRFLVNKSVTDIHFSRFKLKSLPEEDININDLLTIYLLEGCQGMDDAYKYHDILDYFTADNLLQRAQEFTTVLSNACKVSKVNMGEEINDSRLFEVANSLKADVYQRIHHRQLELRDSRWKTAWLLTIFGLLVPIISHIAIWAWYAYRRVNEPLTATTLTEREFLNIYHENNPQFQNDTISMLSVLSAKSPVCEKHQELRARRAIVPIAERHEDEHSRDDNLRNSGPHEVVDFRYADIVTGVTVFSANWNQQAERFEAKTLALAV